MSREQFERLPEGPPYYDYVDGEAIEVNRPTVRHQIILGRLFNVLWEYVHANNLGLVAPEVNVTLSTGNFYGPDIVYLKTEHLSRYHEHRGEIVGTPDLIVEVLSASTAAYDRNEKMEDYHRAGVPWLWYVDQDTLAIEEYQWTPDGYLRRAPLRASRKFKPSLFPDLEIDLPKLLGANGPQEEHV